MKSTPVKKSKRSVKVPLIKIGNSWGIRISKALIDQIELSDEAEIDVQYDHLIIHPIMRSRYGWDGQFQAMAQRGDDQLLDEPIATHWDRNKWKW